MSKRLNYAAQLRELEQQRQVWEQEQAIREIKRSMRRWHPPTTSKLLVALLMLNCTAVELYSMWVMWALADLSALYALISAVIGESVTFAVYSAKAYAETKQEEAVKLERDKLAMQCPDVDDRDIGANSAEDAG